MSAELLQRVMSRATRAGASAADAVLVDAESLETRVRGDEIEHVKQSRERALGIRAFVAGASGLRSAVTSTSDLSVEAVDRMVDETVSLARATAEDAAAGLPDGGFEQHPPDLGLLEPADREAPVEARIDLARRAEAAAHAEDDRIVNSDGSDASSRFQHVAFANSEGFFGEYESAHHGLSCSAIAEDEGGMQVDYWTSVSHTLDGLEDAESLGRTAARRALRRLGSKKIATTEVPVLLEPMTSRGLLGHLASCVTGGSIYRGTSFLAKRLGERIASPLLQVHDDGRRAGGLRSRPFDGEGLATRHTPVIEDGRLTSFLLDSYAGRKLDLASTGNASRGAGSTPSATPTNLWIEPGESDPADLVREMERGLLVTWLFGHGFNPITGDFSRGAAGLWIENGEIVHPVHEITIAGNLGDMLQEIDAVGNDLIWLGSVAAPTLRIARMTVGGE